MKTQRYYHRWKRRYAALLKCLPELLRAGRDLGGAEHIHELRVALRRLRLLANVGRPCLGRQAERAFHQWSRRVSDAASGVRDLDVTLEWLRRHSAAAEIIEQAGSRRSQDWNSLKSRLQLPQASRWEKFRALTHDDHSRTRLFNRHMKLRNEVAGQINEALPRFLQSDDLQQHEFRRAVRRLRFLRELELPRKKHSTDAGLKQLIGFQRVLGEFQNNQIYANYLISLGNSSATLRLQTGLRHERERWRLQILRQIKRSKKQKWLAALKPKTSLD